MMSPEQEALAKKRFFAINAIRMGGVVLILLGMLFAADKIDVPQPPRRLIGILLMGFGMIDVFLVPALLAKRWKS